MKQEKLLDLLNQMTLEEKIGQLVQVARRSIFDGRGRCCNWTIKGFKSIK